MACIIQHLGDNSFLEGPNPQLAKWIWNQHVQSIQRVTGGHDLYLLDKMRKVKSHLGSMIHKKKSLGTISRTSYVFFDCLENGKMLIYILAKVRPKVEFSGLNRLTPVSLLVFTCVKNYCHVNRIKKNSLKHLFSLIITVSRLIVENDPHTCSLCCFHQTYASVLQLFVLRDMVGFTSREIKKIAFFRGFYSIFSSCFKTIVFDLLFPFK